MKQYFTRKRVVKLDVYSECKYTASSVVFETCLTRTYNDVVAFEVVEGEEATKIESETDESCIDDFHEYLVLYFENGETATYRNSYVDMFSW